MAKSAVVPSASTQSVASLSPDELVGVRDAASLCVCANLRRVTRVVTRRFDEALRPTGLRSTQVGILMHIGSEGRIPVSRLASDLAMDASTLTRNLTPLERDGYLAVEKTPAGRRRSVALTERGAALVRGAVPMWRGIQSEVEGSLGSERWQRVRADLAALQ